MHYAIKPGKNVSPTLWTLARRSVHTNQRSDEKFSFWFLCGKISPEITLQYFAGFRSKLVAFKLVLCYSLLRLSNLKGNETHTHITQNLQKSHRTELDTHILHRIRNRQNETHTHISHNIQNTQNETNAHITQNLPAGEQFCPSFCANKSEILSWRLSQLRLLCKLVGANFFLQIQRQNFCTQGHREFCQ